MEAKASVTNIRITPQKAKLVVDLVRGKKCTRCFRFTFFY